MQKNHVMSTVNLPTTNHVFGAACPGSRLLTTMLKWMLISDAKSGVRLRYESA